MLLQIPCTSEARNALEQVCIQLLRERRTAIAIQPAIRLGPEPRTEGAATQVHQSTTTGSLTGTLTNLPPALGVQNGQNFDPALKAERQQPAALRGITPGGTVDWRRVVAAPKARARHARAPADPAKGTRIFSAFWSESPEIMGLWSEFPLLRDRDPLQGVRESRGGLKRYIQSNWTLARRLRVFSSRSDKTLAPKQYFRSASSAPKIDNFRPLPPFLDSEK